MDGMDGANLIGWILGTMRSRRVLRSSIRMIRRRLRKRSSSGLRAMLRTSKEGVRDEMRGLFGFEKKLIFMAATTFVDWEDV